MNQRINIKKTGTGLVIFAGVAACVVIAVLLSHPGKLSVLRRLPGHPEGVASLGRPHALPPLPGVSPAVVPGNAESPGDPSGPFYAVEEVGMFNEGFKQMGPVGKTISIFKASNLQTCQEIISNMRFEKENHLISKHCYPDHGQYEAFFNHVPSKDWYITFQTVDREPSVIIMELNLIGKLQMKPLEIAKGMVAGFMQTTQEYGVDSDAHIISPQGEVHSAAVHQSNSSPAHQTYTDAAFPEALQPAAPEECFPVGTSRAKVIEGMGPPDRIEKIQGGDWLFYQNSYVQLDANNKVVHSYDAGNLKCH